MSTVVEMMHTLLVIESKVNVLSPTDTGLEDVSYRTQFALDTSKSILPF